MMKYTLVRILDNFFNGKYSIFYHGGDNLYSFKNHTNYGDPTQEFLKLLTKQLDGEELPSFKFRFNQAEGLRKKVLLQFFKEAHRDEWQLTFDKFFSFIPVKDIFDSFKLKSNAYKTKNHPYDPTLLFLLTQSYPGIKAGEFIDIIDMPFVPSHENYQEFKTNLLLFIQNHYDLVKNSYAYYSSASMRSKEDNRQQFDLHIYERISKIIKKEDWHEFEHFWQYIRRNDNDESLFSKPVEKYIPISISYNALINKYSTFHNTVYAGKACNHLMRIFREHFSSYCEMINIKDDTNYYQVLVHCKNTQLNEKILYHVFEYFFDVLNESLYVLPHDIKNIQSSAISQEQLTEIYNNGIANVKKYLDYEILNHEMPVNEQPIVRPKI